MRRGAVILVFISCCAFIAAQELSFSRPFQAVKKNIPVAIINSSDCFYVLRYSKAVHDFTVERRAKPSGEMAGFTPLKLDSVNASWFNYEQLDYLFFEHHKQLFFVFEKVVNNKSTVYLKIIDSTSRASGFIELASLEKEKSVQEFGFVFKTTAHNNILIVASQTSYSGNTKKTAMLYDIEKRRLLPPMKLPFENAYTGRSSAFECNRAGTLFYVLTQSRQVGLQRKFIGQAQVQVPVLFHDSLSLVSYQPGEQPQLNKSLMLVNVSSLNNLRVAPCGDSVTVLAQLALQPNEASAVKMYFFTQSFSADLSRRYSAHTTLLDSTLEKTLTFYDGSDYNSPADKEYTPVASVNAGQTHYEIAERRELKYRKEMLVWQTDLSTGAITGQCVVPRKALIMGFTPYNNEGEAMLSTGGTALRLVLLEAGGNFKKPANEFNYHRFKRVSRLPGANLVLYTLYNGSLEKKLLYRNSGFELVPLKYQGNGQSDMIFYLNGGRYEKFAIWRPNPS